MINFLFFLALIIFEEPFLGLGWLFMSANNMIDADKIGFAMVTVICFAAVHKMLGLAKGSK
ncbi:MAG TPA: hypothetical protein VMR41_05150 [Patescibacteria group bacterium]|jgi:ABC-type nitrate/sulfonate/bicarbonate transport system permease component|nr:hypothetical protein [Patescibacteria group bacterium]